MSHTSFSLDPALLNLQFNSFFQLRNLFIIQTHNFLCYPCNECMIGITLKPPKQFQAWWDLTASRRGVKYMSQDTQDHQVPGLWRLRLSAGGAFQFRRIQPVNMGKKRWESWKQGIKTYHIIISFYFFFFYFHSRVNWFELDVRMCKQKRSMQGEVGSG